MAPGRQQQHPGGLENLSRGETAASAVSVGIAVERWQMFCCTVLSSLWKLRASLQGCSMVKQFDQVWIMAPLFSDESVAPSWVSEWDAVHSKRWEWSWFFQVHLAYFRISDQNVAADPHDWLSSSVWVWCGLNSLGVKPSVETSIDIHWLKKTYINTYKTSKWFMIGEKHSIS